MNYKNKTQHEYWNKNTTQEMKRSIWNLEAEEEWKSFKPNRKKNKILSTNLYIKFEFLQFKR